MRKSTACKQAATDWQKPYSTQFMGLVTETGWLQKTGKHRIHWVHAKRTPAGSNKPGHGNTVSDEGKSGGILFAPPLIGAGFSNEIGNLRGFLRKGYELFSFNYAGHGKSSGRFRLRTTLRDTAHALEFLLERAGEKPVYGIASCYSAIPLIHAAHSRGEPLEKIVLVNAVSRILPRATIASFASYYRSRFAGRLCLDTMTGAARRYVADLFPGIAFDRHFFGALSRSRTDVAGILRDALFSDPLGGVILHRTPVLGLYAKQDRVLQIYDTSVGEHYERQLLETCPKTTFYPLPGDHFLSCTASRSTAQKKILDFLARRPRSAAPISHATA